MISTIAEPLSLSFALAPFLGRALKRAPPLPWNDTAAIREELSSAERMEEHARSLARAQTVKPYRQSGSPLLDRLAANEASLINSYQSICAAVDDKAAITPAAEWLIDNFYLVERQIREVRLDLPPAYYRQLPKLADGPFAGLPRVFGLVWAFVAHTDSRFDVDTWCAFIHAYQEEQPLTIGELWASAITLRIILVENLRRIAERIVYSRDERRKADAIADHLLGGGGGSGQTEDDLVDELGPAAPSDALVVQLIHRLRDQSPVFTAYARPARRTAGGGGTDGRRRDPRRTAKADRGQCHGSQHHHEHAAHLRCRLVGHLRTRVVGRPRAGQGLRLREDGFCDPQPLPHGGRAARPWVWPRRAGGRQPRHRGRGRSDRTPPQGSRLLSDRRGPCGVRGRSGLSSALLDRREPRLSRARRRRLCRRRRPRRPAPARLSR